MTDWLYYYCICGLTWLVESTENIKRPDNVGAYVWLYYLKILRSFGNEALNSENAYVTSMFSFSLNIHKDVNGNKRS